MSDNWTTPHSVFDAIERAYGPFDLDAAATDQNALCAAWWTPEDDGLSQGWKGRVWLNPPYSRIGPWTAKAAAEVEAGHADVVVMLVPASTGTRWWRAAVSSGAHAVYWPGRISFGNGKRNAAFDSALLVFGQAPRRVALRCLICNTVFIARQGARTCSGRCRMELSRRGR